MYNYVLIRLCLYQFFNHNHWCIRRTGSSGTLIHHTILSVCILKSVLPNSYAWGATVCRDILSSAIQFTERYYHIIIM